VSKKARGFGTVHKRQRLIVYFCQQGKLKERFSKERFSTKKDIPKLRMRELHSIYENFSGIKEHKNIAELELA